MLITKKLMYVHCTGVSSQCPFPGFQYFIEKLGVDLGMRLGLREREREVGGEGRRNMTEKNHIHVCKALMQ